MMALRLRMLRRHTSLEVSLDDFFTAELLDHDGQPDLNLSVFDIDTDLLVQTHAEYVVSHLAPAPNKKRGGLSLDGCHADVNAVRCAAEGMLFEYARSRHVELRFLRESELRALAEQIYRERSARERSVSARDVLDYARERLATWPAERTPVLFHGEGPSARAMQAAFPLELLLESEGLTQETLVAFAQETMSAQFDLYDRLQRLVVELVRSVERASSGA